MEFQSFQIQLQSKTISDTFSAISVEQPVLGQEISRKILGQEFRFKVGSYSYNPDEGLYHITGDYGIADMLNSDIGSLDTKDAKDIFSSLANALGEESEALFDNFDASGVRVYEEPNFACYETYGSVIQKLFGWTDIVPLTVVNVFERYTDGKKKLYAIQRGNEPFQMYMVDFHECNNLTRNVSQLKLLFPSDNDYYLSGQLDDIVSSNSSGSSGEKYSYLSGQITDDNGQMTLNYTSGLLTSESFSSTDGTITSETKYEYSKLYPPANLLKKTMVRIERPETETPDFDNGTFPQNIIDMIETTSVMTNTMSMDGKNLVESKETKTVVKTGRTYLDKEGNTEPYTETEDHEDSTTYSAMGQNQWCVVHYSDGKVSNSQVVTGNAGATATPFSIKYYSTDRGSHGGNGGKKPPRVKLSGKFSGASSINVSDSNTVARVASAIEGMNGMKQEVIDFTFLGNVLIDFTMVVGLEGVYYYLESNTITVTPRGGVQQNLTMVRWFS